MSNYILINGTLYHHGIKGQKWGNRRFQNEDGSLTPAGREHYGYGAKRQAYEAQKMIYKATKKDARKARLDSYMYDNRHPISRQFGAHRKISNEKAINAATHTRAEKEAKQLMNKAKQEYKNSDEYKQAKDKTKKALIAGAAVAGTALAVYGGYKLAKLKIDRANTIIEGQKLYAKAAADSSRKLYTQAFSYYQGEGYGDKKNAPVNRLNDYYTKRLREDMQRYQKDITKATKIYNDASNASKSSNLNKLKYAYKQAKKDKTNSSYDYNRILDIYRDYINDDKGLRSLYKSDLSYAKNIIRRNNK